MRSDSESTRTSPTPPNTPARPAQPAQPAGRTTPRRRRASSGLAVLGAAPPAGLAVGWENPARGQPERIIPNLANNPVVTAPLNAWSNGAGAWTQLSAGEAADYILVGLQFSYTIAEAGNLHLQIGIGAALAEVPIYETEDTQLFANPPVAGVPFASKYERTAWIKIPAGTRISYRAYWDSPGGAANSAVGLYAVLLPAAGLVWEAWTDLDAQGLRASQALRTPAVPNYLGIPTGAAYTTIIASAPTNLLLHEASAAGTGAARVIAQLAIATGGVGAEVDHAILPFSGPLLALRGMGYSRPARKVLINAGERVAGRELFSATGIAGNYAFVFETIS